MKRHGEVPATILPRMIGIGGPPKEGKTRLAATCCRGCPEWFGQKGVYVEIDPDGAGSFLPEDRPLFEKVTLDSSKFLVDELREVIKHPWEKEGRGTVIIDTGSIFGQELLKQIASKRLFGNNVDLGGVAQPSMGDYTGVDTLYFSLLNLQKSRSQTSPINFITLYHDLEVHPEQGRAGESYGGPLVAGKQLTGKVVAYYNAYMHLIKKPLPRKNLGDPQTYERVLHTETRGLWRAGLRTGHRANPITEIKVGEDPADVWREIYNAVNNPIEESKSV